MCGVAYSGHTSLGPHHLFPLDTCAAQDRALLGSPPHLQQGCGALGGENKDTGLELGVWGGGPHLWAISNHKQGAGMAVGPSPV